MSTIMLLSEQQISVSLVFVFFFSFPRIFVSAGKAYQKITYCTLYSLAWWKAFQHWSHSSLKKKEDKNKTTTQKHYDYQISCHYTMYKMNWITALCLSTLTASQIFYGFTVFYEIHISATVWFRNWSRFKYMWL